ncbi:MAG: hypothetical protein KGN79_12505 [Acidobacteriota bacterium]|nr:hypothetical protein [Acidobacteriota bacterium]
MPYRSPTMPSLDQLAAEIKNQLPHMKAGMLHLWGQRFGRPGEDAVRITGCEVGENCLRLLFDWDEVLALWNPCGLEMTADRLLIRSADAIRYTYYHAGRHSPECIIYHDYVLQNGIVLFRTNQDRIPGSGYLAQGTVGSLPAVRIGDRWQAELR